MRIGGTAGFELATEHIKANIGAKGLRSKSPTFRELATFLERCKIYRFTGACGHYIGNHKYEHAMATVLS